MNHYSAIEKQQIMLQSDLLSNALTLEEQEQLRILNLTQIIDTEQLNATSLNSNLKDKVVNLLGQGMKLGLELEKLAQRGVEILFPSNLKISNQLLNQFVIFPDILFIVGKKDFLFEERIPIVTSYTEFKKATNQVILIADRQFDTLLGYTDISKKLLDGTLLLLTNVYRKQATLKRKEHKRISEKNSNRKKVFISGSRSQKEIPENVQNSLKLIQQQNIEIVIGDSDKGVDNEIIDYLRVTPKYLAVEIYTIKQKPRVKVEKDWAVKLIQTSPSLKPQEQQMVKDRAMADAADWGLVVFKPITKNRYGALQISSGTLRNSIQMLLNKKAVKFFYVINNKVEVANLKTISDLKSLLERYQEEQLMSTEKEEILSAKGVNSNADPAVVKYEKINKKFEELLINEQNINKERMDSTAISSKQMSLFGR